MSAIGILFYGFYLDTFDDFKEGEIFSDKVNNFIECNGFGLGTDYSGGCIDNITRYVFAKNTINDSYNDPLLIDIGDFEIRRSDGELKRVMDNFRLKNRKIGWYLACREEL